MRTAEHLEVHEGLRPQDSPWTRLERNDGDLVARVGVVDPVDNARFGQPGADHGRAAGVHAARQDDGVGRRGHRVAQRDDPRAVGNGGADEGRLRYRDLQDRKLSATSYRGGAQGFGVLRVGPFKGQRQLSGNPDDPCPLEDGQGCRGGKRKRDPRRVRVTARYPHRIEFERGRAAAIGPAGRPAWEALIAPPRWWATTWTGPAWTGPAASPTPLPGTRPSARAGSRGRGATRRTGAFPRPGLGRLDIGRLDLGPLDVGWPRLDDFGFRSLRFRRLGFGGFGFSRFGRNGFYIDSLGIDGLRLRRLPIGGLHLGKLGFRRLGISYLAIRYLRLWRFGIGNFLAIRPTRNSASLAMASRSKPVGSGARADLAGSAALRTGTMSMA